MRKYLAMIVLLLVGAFAIAATSPVSAETTVYQLYLDGWVPVDPDTVDVTLVVHFCPDCDPNIAGNPGCTPFTCNWPPLPMPPPPPLEFQSCTVSPPPAGRYVACMLRRVSDGQILGPIKIVCTPTNCPLSNDVFLTFRFDGVAICEDYDVWMEAYCGLCGHWYNKCCIHPYPIPEFDLSVPVVSALMAALLIPLKKKLRR